MHELSHTRRSADGRERNLPPGQKFLRNGFAIPETIPLTADSADLCASIGPRNVSATGPHSAGHEWIERESRESCLRAATPGDHK
jgi:hypothetical protein